MELEMVDVVGLLSFSSLSFFSLCVCVCVCIVFKKKKNLLSSCKELVLDH